MRQLYSGQETIIKNANCRFGGKHSRSQARSTLLGSTFAFHPLRAPKSTRPSDEGVTYEGGLMHQKKPRGYGKKMHSALSSVNLRPLQQRSKCKTHANTAALLIPTRLSRAGSGRLANHLLEARYGAIPPDNSATGHNDIFRSG